MNEADGAEYVSLPAAMFSNDFSLVVFPVAVPASCEATLAVQDAARVHQKPLRGKMGLISPSIALLRSYPPELQQRGDLRYRIDATDQCPPSRAALGFRSARLRPPRRSSRTPVEDCACAATGNAPIDWRPKRPLVG